MELQKKDQQKKPTWREIYLEETFNVLEDCGFYNRHCKFPRTIKLPITWKECMCELGGMGNQFSTVLLVSTPTGGYPVGMALYGVKPNGVQATVKVYEKSYVGIATKHCDYTHLAIYRISNMRKEQDFVNIEGYSFGTVEAVLCYNASYLKDGTCKSSDESLFTKNTNLDLLNNKLLEKLSNRNCKTPIYIEPLIRLNSNMNQDILNLIDECLEKSENHVDRIGSQYGADQLESFYTDFINQLEELQHKHQFVYVKSQTESWSIHDGDDPCWYTSIDIFYNDNGDAEPLQLYSKFFIYKHNEDSSVVTEDGVSLVERNTNFMRQFTRSYFMTLFGFKSWQYMMEECKEDKMNRNNPSAVYSKYYLTTKQFFTKSDLTK